MCSSLFPIGATRNSMVVEMQARWPQPKRCNTQPQLPPPKASAEVPWHTTSASTSSLLIAHAPSVASALKDGAESSAAQGGSCLKIRQSWHWHLHKGGGRWLWMRAGSSCPWLASTANSWERPGYQCREQFLTSNHCNPSIDMLLK